MDKLESLKSNLFSLGSVVVAYSGGTDSSLLLKVAFDCLGERVLALTAVSPSMPAHERAEAEAVARAIGTRHAWVESRETEDPRYMANTPQRCYVCKSIRFGQLVEFARREGYGWVVDGANADDVDDFRPGQQAAGELGVRSPLQEAGLGKAEIRQLARQLGLPNWDKPASACLASRVPYGDPITAQALAQIERAEQVLGQLGFRQLRVRHHGQLARIELEAADLEAALAQRERIVEQLKGLGYTYVALDLAGFRSGSMNEMLTRP
ncbi:MAG: ATP-dependent sacrificial sulfur transferase LarE [Thermoflexales bacterium]|nr:ATP-dependent sacrificial sulfur transferase LarE [Thermoflexales bacterium]